MRLFSNIFILLLGILLGVLLAMFFVTEQVFVNYNTGGGLSRKLLVGPLVVRDQQVNRGIFQYYPIGNGESGITGSDNWKKAFQFNRNSLVSPNYQAGQVVNEAEKLAAYFPLV